MTKLNDMNWLQGWVLYDAECPFCCEWMARLEPVLTRRGFDLAPLQSPWVQECLDLKFDPPLTEMNVLTPDGKVMGGADAVVFLARFVWWAWPLYALSWFPGMKVILSRVYCWLSRRRICLGATCRAVKYENTTL